MQEKQTSIFLSIFKASFCIEGYISGSYEATSGSTVAWIKLLFINLIN